MSKNEDSSLGDSSSCSEYEPTDAGKLIRFKQYNAYSTTRDRQYLIIMTYFLLFSESDSTADSNDKSSTNEHDPQQEQNNNTPAVQERKSRYSDTRKKVRTGSAQSLRKLKRNRGEAYETKNGKTVPENLIRTSIVNVKINVQRYYQRKISGNFQRIFGRWVISSTKTRTYVVCSFLIQLPRDVLEILIIGAHLNQRQSVTSYIQKRSV